MQGFILNTYPINDEDLIVNILTKDNIFTTYRFYGRRHPIINIGFKIDFELEYNIKFKFPRLYDVINLGFPWILDIKKMILWQEFVKLFYEHLSGIDKLNSFYFNILDYMIKKIAFQDFKRVVVEEYIKLLEFEGRLHNELICLICEKKIDNNLSLVRGFFPTHSYCSHTKIIERNKIKTLFKDKISLYLDDKDIDYLYNIVTEGL